MTFPSRRRRRETALRPLMSHGLSLLIFNILAFSATSYGGSSPKFPYVPTQILLPSTCFDQSSCDTSDVAYIFSDTGSEDGIQFLSLNYANAVEQNTTPDQATNHLPFLKDGDDETTFTAVRAGNDSVVVYAGSCDSENGAVWHYNQQGDGKWNKEETKVDHNASRGPYFLGGTLAFSSTLAPEMDPPTIYTYGGMCSKPSDSESWQKDANYTKTMLSLQPDGNSTDATSYTVDIASVSGPKTAIAGFSITSLAPSVTNISGTITQEGGYVILGGHTQQAFINMSTAAVWNLPEETWSYVTILPPEGTGGTELAIKDIPTPRDIFQRESYDNVYSRSGHTAVLSEDAASIVILGGWVGDVNTPAEPQLAILELSGSYSGWRWKIPEKQPDGKGVYGHGAAVLPGNVMMTYGGWEVGSADLQSRQASGASGPQFLNLTSMEWTSSYTNPVKSSRGKDAPEEGNGSVGAKRLGLGLGLGLGLTFVLVILLALLYLFFKRRQRKEKNGRDAAVRALAQDATRFLSDGEMTERDGFFPWGTTGWYTGGQDPYQQGERSLGYENLRGTSSAYDQTSTPTGPVRKPPPRAARGGYQPAGYNSSTGMIHPILEDDEEDQQQARHHGRSHSDVQTPLSELTDPFATPSAATAPQAYFPSTMDRKTPSPEHLYNSQYDPDVQGWQSEVDQAEGMLTRMNNRKGRTSPTRHNSHRSSALRDDESRSGSNLSESSLKSHRKPFFSLGKDTEHPKPGSSSSSSYNTAKSTFNSLQAEGPSLLLGRPAPPSPGYDQTEHDVRTQPSSPSKSKPLRRGWLGSLRRVFSNSASSSTDGAYDESPRRASLDMLTSDYEPPLFGLSGELLRRKQGRQDWSERETGEPSSLVGRSVGLAQGENEWDIERAVEQRLVQVMFTVPKERLRVVNAGDDDVRDDDSFVQPQVAELVTQDSLSSNDIADAGALHQPPALGLPSFDEPVVVEQRDPYQQLAEASPLSAEFEAISRTPSPRYGREKMSLLGVDDSFDKRLSLSSQWSHGSAAVMQAEAMTMHRPKTKVLQMVDTIESKHNSVASGDSSSPTR